MKIMILAWRFNPLKQREIEITIGGFKILLFMTPFENEQKVSDKEFEILLKLINDNKNDLDNDVFVFIHMGQIQQKDQKSLYDIEDQNCHLFSFEMGQDEIYDLIIDNKDEKILNVQNCTEFYLDKI